MAKRLRPRRQADRADGDRPLSRRTYFELVFILAITAAAIYIAPYARSRLITVGAGFMVGGGFGNALSIIIFPLGVPNPFTVSQGGWTIAFNLADIAVVTGFVLTDDRCLEPWVAPIGTSC